MLKEFFEEMLMERIKELLKMDNYEEICKEWLKQEICSTVNAIEEEQIL